jgi:hypothetical protein
MSESAQVLQPFVLASSMMKAKSRAEAPRMDAAVAKYIGTRPDRAPLVGGSSASAMHRHLGLRLFSTCERFCSGEFMSSPWSDTLTEKSSLRRDATSDCALDSAAYPRILHLGPSAVTIFDRDSR